MKELSHEEAYSELAAVALDVSEVEIGDAVRAHASVCPECGPELAAMEQTVAQLGRLAPRQAMNSERSEAIRSRLVARAVAERESQGGHTSGSRRVSPNVGGVTASPASPTPVTPLRQATTPDVRRSLPNWLAIAAALALIATGAQLYRVTADRNSTRAALASRDAAAPRAESLAVAATAQREELVAALSGPDVKVVTLMSQPGQKVSGRMFWNRMSNDWTMIGELLPPPKPGRTYQVWLVTDDAKISAGTFEPDSRGKVFMHANYALDRNALRAVAITDEPDGGVAAPTGPMVVVGTAL